MGEAAGSNAHPSHTRGRVRLALVVAAVAGLALVIGLRAFFADFYTVRSGSMLPTILPGERVLVRYTRPMLRRYDLVVFRDPEGTAVVKRLVGLPGEVLRVVGGDLVVDGAKLDPRAWPPVWVPLYRPDVGALEDEFVLEGAWSSDAQPGRWIVDAREGRAAATWHKSAFDGWIAPDGERQAGTREVADLALTLELAFVGAGQAQRAEIAVALTEAGDRFELRCADGRAALVRRAARDVEGGPEPEVLADWPLELSNDPDAPTRLRFANVDDHLLVEVDGEIALHAAYGGNRAAEGTLPPGRRTRDPRVEWTVEGARVAVEVVELARDLHWLEAGEHGVDGALQLGLDEIYVLGDNSGDSLDSRYYGPVRLERFVGKPVAITRPWSRVRWLARDAGDGSSR